MKKKKNTLANILLVLAVTVAQFVPSIQVFADALTEEVGLTVSIKNEEDTYVSIYDNYTVNYTGTDIYKYDIMVKTNNYTLDGNNYLLALENDIYTINYNKKILSNNERYVLSKASNDYVMDNISLTALKFNGKMTLKLKLYEIDDIYDDINNGITDIYDVDLTNKEAILTKEISIISTGYTNKININSVKYQTDNILVDQNENIYTIDATKLATNDIELNFMPLLQNADLEEPYYVYYTINGLFIGLDTVNYNGNQKVLSDLSNLINGEYKLDINIVDKLNNEITSTSLDFSLANSNKVLTKEDFKEENINLSTLLSYNNLSDSDKESLSLDDKDLENIDNLTNYYSTDYYIDENISSTLSSANYYIDSFYKIKENTTKVFIVNGTLNHIGANDNRINLNILNNLFTSSNNNVIVLAYDENGDKLDNDTYLKTNMTLEFYVNGLKNTYKVALLGNLSSKDGYVNHDDIINIIDIAINSSKLGDIYKLVSDINHDGNTNILDTTNLMNLLKNGGIPFTSTENPIVSNIKAILNPDKTEVRVGDTFELNLIVKNFKNNKISGLEGIINYDKTLIECTSILNINDWYGNINVINNDSYGKFLTSGYTTLDKDTTVLTYTFKALKEGDAKVYIDNLKSALNGIEVTLKDTKTNTVSVKINRALYSNNNISSIKFSTGKLNHPFDKEVLKYTLYVDYRTTSINISGLLENEFATTTAFKEYDLTGYRTTITIPVTAEDGTVKTYVIDVIKVDNRSSNNYLKDLKIDGANIEFDKKNTEYSIIVENHITELSILATAEDAKSEVTITGNKGLTVGDNTIEVKVQAENGSTRVYKINVTRKDKEKVVEEVNNKNSKLVLIILIVATLAALIYLIFKDNKKEENKEFKLKDRPYNKKQ